MSEGLDPVGVTPDPEPPPVVADAPDAPADGTPPDDGDAAVIEIPTGEKLVPLSALSGARRRASEIKAEAEALRAEKARLEAELQQVVPLAQAFQALRQQTPAAPPIQTAPEAPREDTSELEDVARDFDFYKADGSLDLDRARRYQARVEKAAQRMAEQAVQPLQQQSLQARVEQNIQRALATTHPATKQGVDPQVLGALVRQIAAQPGGMDTLADPEAMKQVWLNAYALSSLTGPAPAASQPVTLAPAVPPVVSEPSGGPSAGPQITLSAFERKVMKEAGMSESEYLKHAAKLKW